MVERQFSCHFCKTDWVESRPKFYRGAHLTCPGCGIEGCLDDGDDSQEEQRQATAQRREARRKRLQMDRERHDNLMNAVSQMQLQIRQLHELSQAQAALLAELAPHIYSEPDMVNLAARLQRLAQAIDPTVTIR